MNKKLFTTAFLFVFFSSIHSFGEIRPDSLLLVLRSSQSDSAKLNLIFRFSNQKIKTDSTFEIKLARELESVVRTIHTKSLVPEGLRLAANLYLKRNRFEKALSLLNEALDSASQITDPGINVELAKIYLDRGSIFYSNGDFQSALQDYIEAGHFFDMAGDNAGLIQTYANLGDLYDKILQPEKRKSYNQKAFGLIAKTTDQRAVARAYTGMATNLIDDKKYDDALDYYLKVIGIAKRMNDNRLEGTAEYDIGFLYSKQKKYNEAFAHYKQSMLLNQKAGDLFGISDAFYKMGLVRYYAGNYAEAGKYLNRAMSIADSINSDILRRNIYDVWYSLEESKGNFKKAYEYLNKYVDVVYRIFDEEGQRQANFLNARYETAKKENEIRKLKDDQEIHLLNLKHQRTWIFLLSVLLLLTAITVWIIVRNIRYKRRLAYQQIKIQEQKIAELEKDRQLLAAQAVLQGEEAERKRLARDLHDGLGGMLSVVKLKLLNMKGNVVLHESDLPVFRNALEMLDGSIRELRRVAHNLMPESLMRYGLKAALTDFCESIEPVNLHFFGEERRLEEKYEVASFRIIQELVNNALKHSEADQINVQVIIETDRMNLVVQDNGKGFDPALVDKTKTTGLSSIRSRVEALNGQMDLISAPGKGTEVQINFRL